MVDTDQIFFADRDQQMSEKHVGGALDHQEGKEEEKPAANNSNLSRGQPGINYRLQYDSHILFKSSLITFSFKGFKELKGKIIALRARELQLLAGKLVYSYIFIFAHLILT